MEHAQWRFHSDFPAGYEVTERRAYGIKKGTDGHIRSSAKSNYVVVDENYHSDFEDLRAHIDSKDVPNARIGNINGTPGAIFEKTAW